MPATRYGVSPWIDAVPAKKRPGFPVFKNTITAPLVIVGGGMTGVMSAYACAAAGLPVILLEADRLGSGGSGRASGVFASEPCESFVGLETQAGRKAARAHFDLTRRAALDLVATVKRLGIKADVETRDAVRVVPPGWPSRALQKEMAARKDASIDGSWQKAAAIVRSVAIASDGGARLPAWGQCDPYRLVLGFAHESVKRGAQIFERSAVLKITFTRKVATVVTAGGRITADKVLLCTGEPTDLVKGLKRHLHFVERTIVLTDPLPADVRKQVGPRTTIATDTEVPPHQIRWTADHRAIVSGGGRGPQSRTPDREDARAAHGSADVRADTVVSRHLRRAAVTRLDAPARAQRGRGDVCRPA